jgi:hypothetical protein
MSFNVTNGGLGITDRYWGTAKRSRPKLDKGKWIFQLSW